MNKISIAQTEMKLSFKRNNIHTLIPSALPLRMAAPDAQVQGMRIPAERGVLCVHRSECGMKRNAEIGLPAPPSEDVLELAAYSIQVIPHPFRRPAAVHSLQAGQDLFERPDGVGAVFR